MLRYKLPKTITIDLEKWRAGGDLQPNDFWYRNQNERVKKNGCGVGTTALRNEYGFMCCLGMAAQQAGVPDKLLHCGDPAEIYDEDLEEAEEEGGDGRVVIQGLSRVVKQQHDGEVFVSIVSTKLADEAMTVNDEDKLTLNERIKKLRAIFKKHGYRLVVSRKNKATPFSAEPLPKKRKKK